MRREREAVHRGAAVLRETAVMVTGDRSLLLAWQVGRYASLYGVTKGMEMRRHGRKVDEAAIVKVIKRMLGGTVLKV